MRAIRELIKSCTCIFIHPCIAWPLVSKFKSPITKQNEANQITYDMFVFRYAGVLLIYAEVLAELGSITQTGLDNSIYLLRARLDEPSLPGGKWHGAR